MTEAKSTISSCSWRPSFMEGVKAYSPLALGIAAWGVVTGAAMLRSGLPLHLVVLMSLTVFAGAAQLIAVPLILAEAPLWLIWLAAFCVNLRFMIYSLHWASYFSRLPRSRRVLLSYFSGDSVYVVFMRRYPEAVPKAGQVPFYLGAALSNWTVWQLSALCGIFLGHLIPGDWNVGFAGTMALLGIACALLKNRISWLVAIVGALVSFSLQGVPLNLNVLLSIVVGVALGVVLSRRSV